MGVFGCGGGVVGGVGGGGVDVGGGLVYLRVDSWVGFVVGGGGSVYRAHTSPPTTDH